MVSRASTRLGVANIRNRGGRAWLLTGTWLQCQTEVEIRLEHEAELRGAIPIGFGADQVRLTICQHGPKCRVGGQPSMIEIEPRLGRVGPYLHPYRAPRRSC